MWLFQCIECRECSTLTLRLVPLLIVRTIIALPSTSIDGLVAKGTLGLLSPRGRQWRGGGIAVTDSSSIHRRGRHFRRRHVWLSPTSAGERGSPDCVLNDVAQSGLVPGRHEVWCTRKGIRRLCELPFWPGIVGRGRWRFNLQPVWRVWRVWRVLVQKVR